MIGGNLAFRIGSWEVNQSDFSMKLLGEMPEEWLREWFGDWLRNWLGEWLGEWLGNGFGMAWGMLQFPQLMLTLRKTRSWYINCLQILWRASMWNSYTLQYLVFLISHVTLLGKIMSNNKFAIPTYMGHPRYHWSWENRSTTQWWSKAFHKNLRHTFFRCTWFCFTVFYFRHMIVCLY